MSMNIYLTELNLDNIRTSKYDLKFGFLCLLQSFIDFKASGLVWSFVKQSYVKHFLTEGMA